MRKGSLRVRRFIPQKWRSGAMLQTSDPWKTDMFDILHDDDDDDDDKLPHHPS
jgi:hypothetical protein